MNIKIFACIILILLLTSCASGIETETFEAAGRWLIKGVGHVDKSFVRSSLNISGYANFYTVDSEDLNLIESFDAYLKVEATTLNAKVYEEYVTDKDLSIPVPSVIPAVTYPIELPEFTYDGLTYYPTITGANSGTVTIKGTVHAGGIIGNVDMDSDCKIWREGTPEPEIDEGKSSGCNSGIIMLSLLLMLGVRGRVRN